MLKDKLNSILKNLLLALVIIINLFFNVSAISIDDWQGNLSSSQEAALEIYQNKYESDLLKRFAYNKELEGDSIGVIIYLKDSSEISNLISDFSDEEMKNVINRDTSNRIAADISEDAFFKLIEDERVDRMYYNRPISMSLDESAPLINANDVWNNLGYTGEGVDVCVIDTGIDTDHSALIGRIAGQHCFCGNNCCPDGTTEDISAEDDNGHGTHVSGIIASSDSTYRGIANGSDLYVVKVLDEYGGGDLFDVGDAIDWCRNQGVDIISMSLGDGEEHPGGSICPSVFDTELNNAYNNGITIVAASGNDGFDNGISYPACASNVISVGATYDEDLGYEGYPSDWVPLSCFDLDADPDELTCYSNTHNGILDLVAPGSEITAAQMGGGFVTKDGTSMSAPHVAGAIALLLDKSPNLDQEDILTTLQGTGVNAEGWPRIDAEAALNNICLTGDWQAGSCGGGGCGSDERYYTRTNDPAQCASTSKCEYDSTCDASGGDPPGVQSCKYVNEFDSYCPSGYEAIDHDCYWSGSNWECELECYREGYCGSYGGEQEENTILLNWDGSNHRGDSFYSPDIFFDNDYCWIFYGRTRFSVSDWGTSDSYSLESDTDEGGSVTECKTSSTTSTYSDVIFFGRGDNTNHRARSEVWDYANSACGGGSPFDDLEGSLTRYIYYSTATYNPADTDFLQCDVPDTTDADIDSTIYTDTDADCYVRVSGVESDPDEIRVRWYVNGDFERSDDCVDNECDDDSGPVWSHTFTLSNSYFNKGDEVYCIGRGEGEDGGHGAYEESSEITVSNRVPALSSITLNKDYAKYGNNIQVTANGEADADSELLSLYCCNGASCTPTTSNHDFCYATGDNYPYDSYCTGQGVSSEGTQTVRCRLYDGDDYSSIQSDTYVADNTAPNITESAINITSALFNETARINCTATDSGVGLGSFLMEADKPSSGNQNYSMSLLSGNTRYVDIQLIEEGTWQFNCWVNDTLGNLANRTPGSITVSSPAPPNVAFGSLTPANESEQSNKNIFVDLISSDAEDHYAFVDFDNDLNLWIRMDDFDVSNNFIDLSSYSLNGSRIGDSFISAGKFGNATIFDANGDYIYIPADKSRLPNNRTTISAWIKPSSNISGDNYRTIAGTYTQYQGGSKGGYGLRVISEGTNYSKLELFYWNGSKYNTLVGNSTLSLGNWNLATATYDGQTIKLYLNGQEDGTYYAPEGFISLDNFYIGALNFSTVGLVDYWNGSIDEVLMFRRALSSNEIMSIYNAGSAQYYYNFTSLANKQYKFTGYAIDESGNKNQTENRIVTVSTPIDVSEFSVVYTNNRERVFRFVIANNYTSTLSDISWILNNGQTNQSSQYNTTLQVGEDLFVYVYYNYTSSGNYTVMASTTNGQFSDRESMEIEVI